MSPARVQRYTKARPCPVCNGYQTLAQGRGERCYGFSSDDGLIAFCTRPEHAGNAPHSAGANAWRHQLRGECGCGLTHGFTGYTAPEPKRSSDREELPPLSADALDMVYRRYLQLLPLRTEHADFYRARSTGIDLEVAQAHGYGSLPKGYKDARCVIDALLLDFGRDVLLRVPGFWARRDRDQIINTHIAKAGDDAAVIPARDEQGRIIGMIRHTTSGDGAKYRTFQNGGGAFYTVAGDDWQEGEYRRLWAVEGIHKAHVAAAQGLGRVMGLPGANLADAHALALESMAPDVAIETLDADKLTNPNIQNARKRMVQKLADVAPEVRSAVWDVQDGKGIDDLLANGGRPRLRTIARRPAFSARLPEVTDTPTPVEVGRSMDIVRHETQRRVREFIAHPQVNKGHMQVIASPPGVGKTDAALKAIRDQRVVARYAVATNAKAQEMEQDYPGIVTAVEGRNKDNCQNFPVVEAARKKHHDIWGVVCEHCPFLDSCRTKRGEYYWQFEQGGSLAGPSELLFSGSFMKRGEVIILDDAALDRSMIDLRQISAGDITQLAQAADSDELRELLLVILRAIVSASDSSQKQLAPPMIGPRAWDALARAAGASSKLIELIQATPNAQDTLPGQDGEPVTVEDIEAAPSADLGVLLDLLKDECHGFATGEEFNSGVSLHPGGIELRRIRPMVTDRETSEPVIAERAVLVLDATPLMPLYDIFGRGLAIDPAYHPVVNLPPNVTVSQVADRFFGKTVLQNEDGRNALLASLVEWRERHPGDREAAICAKSLRDDVTALGIPAERVLTFFGNRGLNTIEDADVLHMLGRPQPPDRVALQLAHVLHKGQAPIAPHMTVRLEGYAGYRASDGTGRAIGVLDFEDRRAAAIFHSLRESEMVQAIHRARLFNVDSPQLGLFDPEGAPIARTAKERQRVRVVIHSAQPIPGLRVDELIYGHVAADSHNRKLADDARTRILDARARLLIDGLPASVAAIAREAKADRRTVAAVVNGNLVRPVDTPNRDTYRGLHRAHQISGASPVVGFPDLPDLPVLAPIPDFGTPSDTRSGRPQECGRCHVQLDDWCGDNLEAGYCRQCVAAGVLDS